MGFSEEVLVAGKERAEELDIDFSTPDWLENVPGDEQAAALCRFIADLSRKREREDMQQLLCNSKSHTMDEIDRLGYSLMYRKTIGDFDVAIAYKWSKIASTSSNHMQMNCYFTVCSDEDRPVRWEAREILLYRIRHDDKKHRFDCFIPKTGNVESWISGQFIDRIHLSHDGLPGGLIKAEAKHRKAFNDAICRA